MKAAFCARTALLIAVGLFTNGLALGQANQVFGSFTRESFADLNAKLSPSQKEALDDAGKAYREGRYADCLELNKQLLKDFPSDPILSRLAGAAAIQVGDPAWAANALKPIAKADPEDWQAASVLVRACAESGDPSCRDAEMSRMTDLHQRGVIPAQLREYSVEKIKLADRTLSISVALFPLGAYKAYAFGDVRDSAGKLLLTISLESSDFDQPGFAKEHPAEAAKGMRLFSLDAYEETGLNATGQRTQTHYTYKLFAGQPDYATMRQEFIDIVTAKSHPMSSRSGLVVP